MPDQATELRRLALRLATRRPPPGRPPRTIGVTGKNVGATTLAINLAVSLSQLGRRVVLIDGDLRRPRVGELCALSAGESIADILFGRLDVHEVLQPGPAGVQIAAGAAVADDPQLTDPRPRRRLETELFGLSRHVDFVVLDTGEPGEGPLEMWSLATELLLVSTPSDAELIRTYAAIKNIAARTAAPPLRLVVNRTVHRKEAREAAARIIRSAKRFLGVEASFAGTIPEDDRRFAAARRAGQPLILSDADSPPALAIAALAELLDNETTLDNRRQSNPRDARNTA